MRAARSAVVATLAVVSAVLTTVVNSPGSIRLASAILLVLVLPGLALTSALFAKRALGAPERFLLAIALSVSLAIVGGLVLHISPFGLTNKSWAVLLAGVTVLGALGAHLRTWPDDDVTAVSSGAERRPDRSRSVPSIRRSWLVSGALLGIALGLTISAMSMARTPLPARGIEGYTALWLLPGAENRRTVDVGVRSIELETTRYRLEVRVGRARVPPYRFTLPTGGVWKASLRVERGYVGTVRALLYLSSDPDRVYRRVRLLVDARGRASLR